MSTEFTNRQWRLPNNENKDKQSNYSMDFDYASSDYIDVGTISLGSTFSLSTWIKPNSFSASTNVVFGGGLGNYAIYIPSSTVIWVNFGGNYHNFTVSSISTTNFTHILFIRTGANGELFVNGVSQGTTSSLGTNSFTVNYLGCENQTAATGYYFDGQIDGVSIFDYALTDGTGGTVNQIATLYGSSSTGIGNPMTLNPVAYYNLGDKSAFNGANYLVPNIAAQEDDGDIATSFSPYALEFDSASSDYINCGNDSSFNTNAVTVSCWVKAPAFSPAIGPAIVSKDNQGGTSRSFGFLFVFGDFLFQNWDSAGNENRVTIAQASNPINTDGQWHHLLATIDGTTNTNGIKVYIDNVVVGQATATATGIRTSTVPFVIGGSGSTGATYTWNGQISNVSYWNAALTSAQVTEIYNEGVPSNLNNHSAYSNLVSWWQLGSNSSFNSSLNQWTCIDEKGTNTGESSQTFNEDAIVDGVGSSANGLSSGMGGDEVIGDAPYSSSNSLSVNMDVLDRVTDTPS